MKKQLPFSFSQSAGEMSEMGIKSAIYILMGCVLACCPELLGADAVLQVGGEKQLFAGPWTEDGRDAHLVESMKNVTMRMNEARVTREKIPVPGHGFMMRDGGVFRLYYSTPGDVERAHHFVVRYAESDDALSWRKPSLGLYEWQGSRDNNILFPNDAFPYAFSSAYVWTIFVDPNAKSPSQRYKMVVKLTPPAKDTSDSGLKPLPLRKGKYGFTSPDGIRWTRVTGRLGTSGDGGFRPFWDARVGSYVAYSRVKTFDDPRQKDYYRRVYNNRRTGWHSRFLRLGRSTSDDFLHWSKESIVMAPDAIDEAHSDAPNRVDFYSIPVFKYTPDIYIALPSIYSHWKAFVKEDGRLAQLPGTIDVQLATSRDGIRWNRAPGRRPFIRLGPQGSFWSGMVFARSPLAFRDGNDLHFFFEGWDKAHNDPARTRPPVWGRAVLRVDGFISADAAYTGGELTTRTLTFSGKQLQLNVATGAGGIVRVEIQDDAGQPLEGFGADDADEINGNYLQIKASWKGSSNVASLAGKNIRLRFQMRDASLYSFQFVH